MRETHEHNEASPRDFAWSIFRHADAMLHQRHYNFATTEAFLFVAAGAGFARTDLLKTFVPSIAAVGTVLAIVWWLATVRLERPRTAIRMHFILDSTFACYDQATWKRVYSCLLINDLPPTLVFLAWVAIFLSSVGHPVFGEWRALLLVPLSFALAGLLHRIESRRSDAFLHKYKLDQPVTLEAQPNSLCPMSDAGAQANSETQ